MLVRYDFSRRNRATTFWIDNLVTIWTVEMISLANGFASIILAWLGGSTRTTGARAFEGYQIYTADSFEYSKLSVACQNALQAAILCDDYTRFWTQASYHGNLGDAALTDSICDAGCASSLAQWVKGVNTSCAGHTSDDGLPPAVLGNYIWYGVNETCQKDESTRAYCNGQQPAPRP
jgi:hypothetical protein